MRVFFNEGSYLMHPGDAIFITSNFSHMSKPTTNHCKTRYLSLNINPSVLTLFHGSVIEQKYFLPYLEDPKMQVLIFSYDGIVQESCLEEIKNLFAIISEKKFGYEIEAYSKILHLWKILLDYSGKKTRLHVVESPIAREMINYLKNNFSENITLEDIAKHVHLSKSTCSRIFSDTYGEPIFTYLIGLRIEESINLITSTHFSVSEISQKCGFSSESYFIKCFKEKTNKTPLQYKKEFRK